MLSRTVFASQGNILYPNQKLWLIPIKPTATEHIVDKKVIEDEIVEGEKEEDCGADQERKAWFLAHFS